MEKTAQQILEEVEMDMELKRKGIDPVELRRKVEEDVMYE